MPHAAHLIVADDCRFHLATWVGGHIVSTVGEWLPDESVRERLALSRGIELRGRGDARRADFLKRLGYEEIGAGRRYETMVFPAKANPGSCCRYVAAEFHELDTGCYNDALAAYEGHLALCDAWTPYAAPQELTDAAKTDDAAMRKLWDWIDENPRRERVPG
jgi:hypothetical protein